MKKIIFALLLLTSSFGISRAQINEIITNDSSSTNTKQVEFYVSIEEFYKENPHFFIELITIAIANQAATIASRNFYQLKKEVLASR